MMMNVKSTNQFNSYVIRTIRMSHGVRLKTIFTSPIMGAMDRFLFFEKWNVLNLTKSCCDVSFVLLLLLLIHSATAIKYTVLYWIKSNPLPRDHINHTHLPQRLEHSTQFNFSTYDIVDDDGDEQNISLQKICFKFDRFESILTDG